MKLRGYQEKAVDGVRIEYVNGKMRVVLVLPTGGGKTVVASFIVNSTVANNKKILFLAHRKELLTQCGEKLTRFGVNFGYLNPKFTPSPLFNVQVGTMQTVVKRMKIMKFVPDLIIVDECHRAMNKTYQAILAFYPKARVLGLTATPVRGDGKPLGEYFDAMVIGPTIKELIAMGALVPPRTFGPASFLDLSKVDVVRQEDGSYDLNRKQVEDIINKPGITGDAVERYNALCPGAPAVAFCVSVMHAQHVAAEFCKAGYKFEVVHGDMPEKDKMGPDGRLIRGRTNVFADLADGKIHGITSVDLVTEGVDIPSLQVAIMLRPTLSEGLYLQMAGRVLRSHPGKVCAYIIDHAGCSIMHGLVTRVREWTLAVPPADKKRKRSKSTTPLVKIMQCPKCFLQHEPAPSCPDCGHKYEIEGDLPNKKRGQLVEITEEQADFIDFLKKVPTTPSEIRKEIAQAKSFKDLLDIQKNYGYKKGWANGVWSARNKKHAIV